VSSVKYEVESYIPEDAIPHSHRRENLKSYTLNPYSSLNVRNQVSRRYKATGKIVVHYILIFTLSEDKRSWTKL
jgi:hypothetical protein